MTNQKALLLAYEALKLILSDDEGNRGTCPCGAKHIKVTRQRMAWAAMRAVEKELGHD